MLQILKGMKEGDWRHLTRHLLHDLQKGLSKKAMQQFRGTVSRPYPVEVTRMELTGVGCVANVSLASQEHMALFFKVRSKNSKCRHRVFGVRF